MKNYKELQSKLINNKNISRDVLISTINELTESLNLLPYGALEFDSQLQLESKLIKLIIKNNNLKTKNPH